MSELRKETGPIDRKSTFTRRGLLQWSVPAILAVTLPSQTYAGTHSDHMDHQDVHVDTHGDSHMDTHIDSHGDSHIDASIPGVSHGDSHDDTHGDRNK